MVSMGVVWDRATEFLSDNLAPLIPVALFAIFVPVSISQSIAPLKSVGGTGGMSVQLFSLLLSLVSAWGQLVVMALALDANAGRAAAVGTANRRMLPVIGIWSILTVVMILLVLPVVIVLGASGYDFQAAAAGGSAEIPPGAAGFVALYGLLALSVLLWLVARLLLVTPTVLMERRGLGAITRAFKLSRATQFKIIGIILLYGLVSLVSLLAAKLVFGSIFRLVTSGDGPVTLASVLTSILVSVVMTVFALLSAAFTAKLYLAIRDAREAIVESA